MNKHNYLLLQHVCTEDDLCINHLLLNNEIIIIRNL